jgi:hypothetical protein
MSGKRDEDTGKRRDFLKLAGFAAVTGGGLLAGGTKPAEAAVEAETASEGIARPSMSRRITSWRGSRRSGAKVECPGSFRLPKGWSGRMRGRQDA